MPLRDHFRPPLDEMLSWQELHGQWPAVIVQQLHKQLPAGYAVGPRVHSGSQIEIDVAAFEKDEQASAHRTSEGNGGVAVATWAPALPSLDVETTLPDYDEYEVRVYDATRGRTLVAAIEIVSPANKDRPEHRNIFVGKCAALLQKGVAVSIVDLVTVRNFNLYAELLTFIGHSDPSFGEYTPPVYAASCRWVTKEKQTRLQTWSHALAFGLPLPTLPVWLSQKLSVPVDLEQSYEQACADLAIT
jgi:Protein of unknown function (DUF4058)